MKAPARAVRPPSIQAPKMRNDEWTWRATTYGLTKMPEPIDAAHDDHGAVEETEAAGQMRGWFTKSAGLPFGVRLRRHCFARRSSSMKLIRRSRRLWLPACVAAILPSSSAAPAIRSITGARRFGASLLNRLALALGLDHLHEPAAGIRRGTSRGRSRQRGPPPASPPAQFPAASHSRSHPA